MRRGRAGAPRPVPPPHPPAARPPDLPAVSRPPAPRFPAPVIALGAGRGTGRVPSAPARSAPFGAGRGRPSPARAPGHRHPPPGEDGAGGFELNARGYGSGTAFCKENDGIQSKLVDKCRYLPRLENLSSVCASRSGMRGHGGVFKFLKLSLENGGFLWALLSRRSAFQHVQIPLPLLGHTGSSDLAMPLYTSPSPPERVCSNHGKHSKE